MRVPRAIRGRCAKTRLGRILPRWNLLPLRTTVCTRISRGAIHVPCFVLRATIFLLSRTIFVRFSKEKRADVATVWARTHSSPCPPSLATDRVPLHARATTTQLGLVATATYGARLSHIPMHGDTAVVESVTAREPAWRVACSEPAKTNGTPRVRLEARAVGRPHIVPGHGSKLYLVDVVFSRCVRGVGIEIHEHC